MRYSRTLGVERGNLRLSIASATCVVLAATSLVAGAPAAQASGACAVASTAYDRSVSGKVYALVTITQQAKCTWTIPSGADEISFLVVGGGGAAGTSWPTSGSVTYPGGGGGGGGVGVFTPPSGQTGVGSSFELEVGQGGTVGASAPGDAKASNIYSGASIVFTAGFGGAGSKGTNTGNSGNGFSGETASSGGGSGGGAGLSGDSSATAGSGGSAGSGSTNAGSGASATTTQSGGGGGAAGAAAGNATGTAGGSGLAIPTAFAAAFANGAVLAPGGVGGVKDLITTTPRNSAYGAGGNAYANSADIAQANGNSGVIVVRYLALPSPPDVPAQPTAVAGDGQATVTVTQGSGSGGTPDSFTVTASGGASTCTISSPSGTPASGSCVVSGLTNGTAYTFTATATNLDGISLASAASNSVTPTASGGGGGSGGGGAAPTSSDTTEPSNSATTPPTPTNITLMQTSGAATAALVSGQTMSITAQSTPAPVIGASPNGVVISGGGLEASMIGPPLAGVQTPGNLVMVAGQPFELSLGGLASGSIVGIYVMPSGLLIGTLTVNADGQVLGSPILPESVAGQVASIQITGTTASGSTMNLAVGATVGPPAIPVPTPAGPLPAPALGGSFVMVDQVPVPTTPDRVGSTLVVNEQEATVSMRADTTTGQPQPLGGDGALQIQDDGSVRVEGIGMVGTVDVFAFSKPTYLGRVLVRPDGTFAGSLPVPTSLSPGRHTLQLVGDAQNGTEVAVSLGVEKSAPTTPARSTKASTRIHFAANSAALTNSAKTKLQRLVTRTGKDVSRVVSVGYVQQTNSQQNDHRLSRARAQAAASYLRSLGVKARYSIRAGGAAGATATDRSAMVTITHVAPPSRN